MFSVKTSPAHIDSIEPAPKFLCGEGVLLEMGWVSVYFALSAILVELQMEWAALQDSEKKPVCFPGEFLFSFHYFLDFAPKFVADSVPSLKRRSSKKL
jgi:hypothetical protein